MKRYRKINTALLFLFLLAGLLSSAQEENSMAVFREHEMSSWKDLISRSQQHINDTTIDVRFYHLDIEIALDSVYISGNVKIIFEPRMDDLSELFLDLHQSLTVDSISSPCSSFSQSGDKIWIDLESEYDIGEQIELVIHYHGKPSNPGGFKGLVYKDHGNGEPVIATLSTPYLAHSWYPCKDGPEDKADSVYIDITIEKRTIDGIEVLAISNGFLEDIVHSSDKTTFEWRHRYPIVTYYVMVAISNYAFIAEDYNDGEGLSFPLIYYVFEENYQQSVEGVEDIPEAISLFNDLFGDYPFHEEKFGMTELGFYGAIENQTNVIQNTLRPSWFLISVHELAHMWFADMITCETWHDGWLNEGFATYCEALWIEHKNGLAAYHGYMNQMQYFDGGTVYLQDTDDPFSIFIPIIYRKGAWVLHMLRGAVGDSLFFESLRNYSLNTNFRFGHANTDDLKEVFETTTELDLTAYFDQWIFDEYYPVYNYNFKQESDELQVTIYQSQKESGWREIFEMPVDIYVHFEDDSDTIIEVYNDEVLQHYSFDFEKSVDTVEIDRDHWILRKINFSEELPVIINVPPGKDLHFVYPNPTNNEITIEINGINYFPAYFELYDLSGKIIFKGNLRSNKTIIDLSSIKEGIYFYRILNSEQLKPITGKLIKKQ